MKFTMFVGPMFGGKTTKLLSALDRYKYQGRQLHVFKPSVDERYSRGEIVTHWGTKLKATRIKDGEEIYDYLDQHWVNGGDVIAVDEAFMIRGIADVLISLYRRGHTVLVSSLQLSSDGSPSKEVMKMMPYATKIEVCPAVCSECCNDAYYTQKIGGRSDHKIEVGGAEMYQPRCHHHFK